MIPSLLNGIDRILRYSWNSISPAHPTVENISKSVVRYYTLSWIWAAKTIASIRYDAPIEPVRLYHVDPNAIDRTVTWNRISTNKKEREHPRFRPPNYRLAGRVFDGTWDLVDSSFSDSTVYRSFKRHFTEDVPWEETRFYSEALLAMEEGGVPWNCRTQADLDARCQYLDDLYERIERDGYKTQDELHESGDEQTSRYHLFRVVWDEIVVNVGRNGQFIFLDGRNRLAIARVQELETVPVVILVRHKQWQRIRDKVARGDLTRSDLPTELQTHPDLVDLFVERPSPPPGGKTGSDPVHLDG